MIQFEKQSNLNYQIFLKLLGSTIGSSYDPTFSNLNRELASVYTASHMHALKYKTCATHFFVQADPPLPITPITAPLLTSADVFRAGMQLRLHGKVHQNELANVLSGKILNQTHDGELTRGIVVDYTSTYD